MANQCETPVDETNRGATEVNVVGAEIAVDKKATTLLMPVAARRQLNDLPDDMWTKINIEFYKDPADAVFKALVE